VRLASFIELLPQDLQHVFEFRDSSWYDEEVLGLLGQSGCAFCVHDFPGVISPKWVSGDLIYCRFHGTGEKYSGCYGKKLLAPWAKWLKKHLGGKKAVYAYFNNDESAYAVRDAKSLREELM